jgi:hypothetical protein
MPTETLPAPVEQNGPGSLRATVEALNAREGRLLERRDELTCELAEVNGELDLIQTFFTRICKEIQPRD